MEIQSKHCINPFHVTFSDQLQPLTIKKKLTLEHSIKVSMASCDSRVIEFPLHNIIDKFEVNICYLQCAPKLRAMKFRVDYFLDLGPRFCLL